MSIYVADVDGTCYDVDATMSTTYKDVKNVLEEQHGIKHTLLTLDNVECDDEQLVCPYETLIIHFDQASYITEFLETKTFEDCPDEMRNDYHACLIIAKNHPSHFRWCSDEMRNDKSICLEAVKYMHGNLSHCSEEMRNDKDVCSLAIRYHSRDFFLCSDNMKNDKEVCIAAIKYDPYLFNQMSDKMLDDEDVHAAWLRGM